MKIEFVLYTKSYKIFANKKDLPQKSISKYLNKYFYVVMMIYLSSITLELSGQSFGFVDMRCDSNIVFQSMVQIPSGGFYAVGAFTTDYSTGDSTGASLYKLDANMNILWEKHYGGSKEDFFYGVKYYRDDKLVIFGYTSSSDGDLINTSWPQGNRNVWVVIIDTIGNFKHSATYGYGSSTGILDIDFTKDGDIYIAGASVAEGGDFAGLNNQFLSYNIYVAKLDSQLHKKAFRVFQGSNDDDQVYMSVINNNSIILSVTTSSHDSDYVVNTPVPNSYNVITSIDSNLNTKWQKRYGCGIHIECAMLYDSVTHCIYSLSATICKTGTCLDTNYTYLNNYGNAYTWVKKLDTLGNIIWSRIYGGFSPINFSGKPSVGPYNGVIADGYLWILNSATGIDNHDLGTDSAKLWLIKLDTATGKILSKQRFGNKDVDAGGNYNPLIKSTTENCFYTLANADNSFYYLNPLNCMVDTLPSNKETYHIFKIIEWPDKLQEMDKTIDNVKIYPNPATSEIIIELDSQENFIFFSINNMQGKQCIAQQFKNKITKIDISSLPAGNYVVAIYNKSKKISKTITINN